MEKYPNFASPLGSERYKSLNLLKIERRYLIHRLYQINSKIKEAQINRDYNELNMLNHKVKLLKEVLNLYTHPLDYFKTK